MWAGENQGGYIILFEFNGELQQMVTVTVIYIPLLLLGRKWVDL